VSRSIYRAGLSRCLSSRRMARSDAALEPIVPDADLLRLYKTMLLARRLDERCLLLQRQGRMGTYGPGKGQEAASLAPRTCCAPTTGSCRSVPRMRRSAVARLASADLDAHVGRLRRKATSSPTTSRTCPSPCLSPAQCQYGMGIAWGCKLRGKGQVCVTYCGDGATSEGDFHEALNFAGVYSLPLIMVVQNNGWAISLPRNAARPRPKTLAQKAVAYRHRRLPGRRQ